VIWHYKEPQTSLTPIEVARILKGKLLVDEEDNMLTVIARASSYPDINNSSVIKKTLEF